MYKTPALPRLSIQDVSVLRIERSQIAMAFKTLAAILALTALQVTNGTYASPVHVTKSLNVFF